MAGPRLTALAEQPASTTARNSTTVAGWTLLSRVTGLLRVVALGAVLGPTYFGNLFQAGYIVPNLLCTVVAGRVLAMVVVPAAVRAIEDGGVRRAAGVFGGVSGFLLTASGGIAVLLAVLSPVVAWTLTFGIPDAESRARAHQLTIILILFVAPQVVLYTVAALGAAAQQARGRFALAAGASAVENLGLIATVLVAGLVFGTGLEVDEVPVNLVIALGVGSTASVVLHAALQVFGAVRVGMVTRPSLYWRQDPASADAVRRILGSIGVAVCPAVAMYTLLALAGTVPGGVLVVQLCYAAFYTLAALGARAVATAVLPQLAQAAHGGDPSNFASSWRQGLSYAAIASLPAFCLLALFAEPAANVLATGELRTEAVIAQLAACLAVIAVAQLAGGVHEVGRQALFARLDDRGPRIASAVGLAATLLVGAGALLLPVGAPRLVALTLAILVGEAAGAATVLLRLRAAIRPESIVDIRLLGAALAATACMLPVAVGGWWLQESTAAGRLGELALLAFCGAAALGSYVLAFRAVAPRRIGGTS